MTQEFGDVSPFMPELHLRDGFTLRAFAPEDEVALYELALKNQQHLAPTVAWADENFSPHIISGFHELNQKAMEDGTALAAGLYDGDELIGTVDTREFDSADGAEIGYWIDKDYEGRGLITEAARAMIDESRRQHPEISRFRLNTYETNAASSRVAEKLGFELIETTTDEQGVAERHYVQNYE